MITIKVCRTISYKANLIIPEVIPIDLLINEQISIKEGSITVDDGRPREASNRRRRQDTLDIWQQK